MEKMKLKKLICLVQKNDEAAFQELYHRYHRLVFYVAYQVTKNHADAEEIVQETFVQVTRSIDSLKDPDQFKSWVGRIAYTKAITFLRKNRDQQMSDQQLEMLSNKTESRWDYCPDEKSHHDADMRVLHECMSKLKLPYREVLTLYYFAQLNIKEISDLTEYPEGTVKSRLLYGKKYLREEIEQYEQMNQVKLDFHATSLEAMLMSAAFSLALEPANHTLFVFKRFDYDSLCKTAGVMCKTAGAMALTFGILYGGYYVLKESGYIESTVNSSEETYQESQINFPMLRYEEEWIYTPREAYTLLMEKAHCEVEIALLSNSQLAQIEQIYLALEHYGGVYRDLLHTSEWDKLYNKMIKK